MSRVALPLRHFLQIVDRDHYVCHVCGQGYDRNDPWEIDHDVPVARGGTDHLSNLRLCHRSCNRDKAAS